MKRAKRENLSQHASREKCEQINERKERARRFCAFRVKRKNDLLKEIEGIYYRTTTFPQIKNIVAANSHLFKCGIQQGRREGKYLYNIAVIIHRPIGPRVGLTRSEALDT